MKKGFLTLFTGNMFGGKTSELINQFIKEKNKGIKVEITKPSSDTRYSFNSISTHNKITIEASFLVNPYYPDEILKKISKKTETLFIDEISLFYNSNSSIFLTIQTLLENNINIVASGLSHDFRHQPFNEVLKLIEISDKHKIFLAKCSICGETGDRTQRLIKQENSFLPAKSNDPIILVGNTDLYEPRCKNHHFLR